MTKQKSLWHKKNVSLALAAFLFAISAIFSATSVESKSRTQKTQKVDKTEILTESAIESGSVEATPRQRVISLTFKQMGAWSTINLRGVDGSRTLSFPIRADEVVVAAKLRFAYDYSPALIPELSHLQIFFNERIAGLEALPKDKGLSNTRELTLDPRWFKENNNLGFKLIGHYTRQCEDPFHSSLWLNLSDLGRLELTLESVAGSNNLKNLPAPFFDKRENTPLKLPFVFASAPAFGTIKAAGVVASWFGIEAGNRGAQFPVVINALPSGNAVVFMRSGDEIAGIKGTVASTVSIQTHPTNPYAKLLVLSGSTDEELARAARAIALVNPTLSGSFVTVTKETEAAPRKPYDAPAWLPTDRPVRLGEFMRPDELRVHGYYPEVIRLNYRVSPDIFTWRTPGTPLKLKYRATRLPLHHNSSLNVGLNANFIQTLALNVPDNKLTEADPLNLPGTAKNALREENLFIPPYATGGRDQLQLGYYFDVIKQGECMGLPPDNLQAAIDPESTLDFSGFPHYAALPNLAYFANIGFPFTRMADLAETAVVLPEQPNADEVGIYLAVMGRMGEATAYPALRHAVISAVDIEKVSARDLIVIGTGNTQSLMTKWADRLPLAQVGGERRVREPDATWRPVYRWEQQDVQETPQPKGALNLTGMGNLALLMAFESPMQASRSVVFIYADKASDLRTIAEALSDAERIPSIQGDFAVIDDKNVKHTKVSQTYYVGTLSPVNKVRWFFSDQPLLLALIGLLICILLAVLVYRALRHMRAKRLKKASAP